MDLWYKTSKLEGYTKFERTLSIIDTHLHSDFVIKVDSLTGDVTSYHVHKCFLAIASPVWERNILWAQDSSTMKINGFPLDVISCLLIYAYTNVIQFHSLEFSLEVLMAADYFGIANISDNCIQYITDLFSNFNISVEDLILVFNVSSLHRVIKLIELCVAYIGDNPDYILTNKEFNNLTLESVMYIIYLNNHLISEPKLITTILNWSILQTEFDNLRNYLTENEIINAFRFRLLSFDDLQNIFRNYPTIFTKQEQFEMINCIQKNIPVPLDFISSIDYPRGEFNVINNDEIIVKTPPVVIIEKFEYIFGVTIFPIFCLEIEPRNNLFLSTLGGRYEESISIKIAGHKKDYDIVLKDRHGFIFSVPFNVYIKPNQILKIEITLKKPGVYKKNDNFNMTHSDILRREKGLIRSINNFENSFVYSQQLESGDADLSDDS